MTTLLWMTAAAIPVLIILSAFFSGSETALTAASRARMLQMEKAGDRPAGLVGAAGRIQRSPDGQLVAGIAFGVEVQHHLEDRPVAVEVEVLGPEPYVIDHPADGRVADQHRSEDRGLGLDVVRRALGGYFSSATIVLTEAVAPPGISTSIM